MPPKWPWIGTVLVMEEIERSRAPECTIRYPSKMATPIEGGVTAFIA